MKKLILFIIVLFSSWRPSFACGYWPFGEDVRFSLLLPEYFSYPQYASFNYNSLQFGFGSSEEDYDANVKDWYQFTHEKVPLRDIAELLYQSGIAAVTPQSDNAFAKYLYQNKQRDVIDYLTLAKECEDLNGMGIDTDPWERNTETIKVNRGIYIKKLEAKLNKERTDFLKRRYAFLIIRLAYYDGNNELLKQYFQRYFERSSKDFLYYWSLYFYCFTPDATGADVADVMVHSVEKRDASYYYFHEKFDLDEALAAAANDEERANVYAYASVQKVDKSLPYLQQIYMYNPGAPILGFLLLREVNKLEDWIYTPYYTNFTPSIEYADSYWHEDENASTQTLRNRSEADRGYARELLAMVNDAELSKVNNPMLWKAVQVQLLFMSREYNACVEKCNIFLQQYANAKVAQEVEQIKALCLIVSQEKGKAVIPVAAEQIMRKNLNSASFLFAAGRELEYLGDLPDAAALISFSNKTQRSSRGDYVNIEWQGNRLERSGNMKYFSDYFDYLDFVYTADEVKKIIATLNQPKGDFFHQTLYRYLLSDKNYLTDLLGTKYIREERLEEALKTFRSIGSQYWEDNYNAWERDRFDDGYYAFHNNPFYDFRYTPDFIKHKEKFIVTKLSVTEHLIHYLHLATDSTNPNRDYYYFLVANCYFNMSQYGNAWMMRRFTSSSNFGERESYIDEEEYRNNDLAQHYYQLAYEHSKTRKFKALCLRMEAYAKDNWPNDFEQLKRQFPEYYQDLSSCNNLTSYFRP